MLSDDKLQDIKSRFGIIGNAEQLNRAIDRAYQVAPTDYSVLVMGESGVGKEFFPKIIHAYSIRKHAPYIAINCGAIPNGTIDSELFGHVKGAFTGAVNDHKGYFEQANGGTIFLDEVGELPLETQVRLLRVLETGEFIRVGSSNVQKTDVRVVAATNLNMQEAIQSGRFREDLYYRLSTISIFVPALRERKEDIPILFRKFALDCTDRYKMPAVRLTEDAKQLLQNYYFRGNIRQLKNITEQVCVLEQRREISAATLQQYLPQEEIWRTPAVTHYSGTDYQTEREILYKVLFEMKHEIDMLKQQVEQLSGGGVKSPIHSNSAPQPTILTATPETHHTEEPIQTAEVMDEEQEEVRISPPTQAPSEAIEPMIQITQKSNLSPMQQFEKETIRRALEQNKGNRKAAANQIKMSERTLYRKIKDYNL